MSNAIHQYDTYLAYNAGAGAAIDAADNTFTELEEVTKIAPPKRKGAKADATHLRSPGFRKEFLASWQDPGDASFNLHYTSSSMTTLTGFLPQTVGNNIVIQTILFRLYLPLEPGAATRAHISFFAQLNGASLMDVEVADKVHEIECELAVQGEAAFTPAT